MFIDRSFCRAGLCAVLFLAGTLAAPASAPACPDADKLVEHMILAHGGMERWAASPTVSFEDEFVVVGVPGAMASRVTVEQGPRRAYIDYPGTGMSLAWDGTTAWSENWALPYPPRFFALLNYHFLNLPWLAADPGVELSEFGTAHLPDDETDYFTAKITYSQGVGDTPGDYYRLYVHPESHLLHAVQYIATYSALRPEGASGEMPPNTLIYEQHAEVEGLQLPTRYSIYNNDGSLFASVDVRDWSFERPFDLSRMTMPEGAVVDESTP